MLIKTTNKKTYKTILKVKKTITYLVKRNTLFKPM